MLQTIGRVDRAGSKTDSVQRILFAAGTVEEKVETSVRAKLKNISDLHEKALTEPETPSTNNAHMNEKPTQTPAEKLHAEHGPSSLKYKEICPSWRNRDTKNWASEKGDRIHEAMEFDDPSKCANDEERAIYESLQGFVGNIIRRRTGK
jgi:hypothetical protein